MERSEETSLRACVPRKLLIGGIGYDGAVEDSWGAACWLQHWLIRYYSFPSNKLWSLTHAAVQQVNQGRGHSLEHSGRLP